MQVTVIPWRIPELAGLTRGQRKIFIALALHVLIKERRSATLVPLLLSCVGGVIGCLVCVSGFDSVRVWPGLDAISSLFFQMVIGAGVGALAGSLVGNAWLVHLIRPYLRKML